MERRDDPAVTTSSVTPLKDQAGAAWKAQARPRQGGAPGESGDAGRECAWRQGGASVSCFSVALGLVANVLVTNACALFHGFVDMLVFTRALRVRNCDAIVKRWPRVP